MELNGNNEIKTNNYSRDSNSCMEKRKGSGHDTTRYYAGNKLSLVLR